MSIPISQLVNGGLPNGDIEIPATNPLNTTQSLNGTTFKYILADILQYILIAQGFTTYTSCRVATTAALTATYANGVAGVGATLTNAGAQVALSIDGVALALNDRVLIKDQLNTFENGIYTVTTVGSNTANWVLTRADDYNEPAEIVYLGVVAITQGTQNASLVFQENSQGPFVIGTSPITYQQLQIDISLLPSASPANKILRSDGTYWVQSTNASLDSSDKLYDLSELQVDNININGNSITSTDVGGNIVITPNTVGSIVLDGLNWPQVDGTTSQALTTDGAGQLGWSTVSTVTTPTTDKAIAIFNGTGGALQNSDISIPSSKVIKNIQYFEDINGLNTLELVNVPSAVNWVKIANQQTNLPPEIQVEGSDANIGMNFRAKGAAGFQFLSEQASNQYAFYSGTTYQHDTNFNFPNTAGSQTVTFPDLTGTVALSGAGQSVTFGQLDVDNIEINGNTISSTDTNGDLILTPNGTGDLVLDGLNWPQADGSNGQAVTTNGSGQLGWSTVSTVTTPTIDQRIARFNGTAGALEDSLVSIDDAGIMSGATQLNVDNLRLDGNTISSTDTNGNIQLNANGTGQVEIDDPGLETGGILVDGAAFETAFRVNDIGGAAPAQMILHRHSTTWEPIILSARSNSNTSAHATVTAGMPVLNIYGTGWLNSYYGTMASITFSADTTGTLADGSAPGRLQFNVTPDGALLPVTAMTINNNGVVTLANALPSSSGGTGINNGASTITLGGSLTTSGAFASTFTMTNTTAVTFPTSGTLATTSQLPTPAAMTRVDDTNVTLTLGGTPATSLLQAVSLTLGWTGQLGVSRGGTGASTVGASGTLAQSNGTNYTFTTATYPSTATSSGTMLRADGTNWLASTSTFADTYSASSLLYSNGANTVTGLTTANSATLVTNSTGVPAWTSSMTNGQLLIGSTGATPVLATLTAGPGVSIANAAGSITISGTGSGIGWTEVTGTSQTMSADNGYVSSNAGLVTFTLPTTAAFGTVINVVGKGAGGWKIAQNAGQNIQLGSSSSTAGVTGYIASTNQYDSIELLCTTANTTWTVLGGPQGNITVA